VIDIRRLEYDPISDEKDIDRELERQLFSKSKMLLLVRRNFPKTYKAEVENKKVLVIEPLERWFSENQYKLAWVLTIHNTSIVYIDT